MSLNMSALADVAGGSTDDAELAKYDIMPLEIREALKAKLSKRRVEAAEAVADDIVKLVDLHDEAVKAGVERIRQLRREIKETQSELTALNAARLTGLQSQNFLPLAITLGITSVTEALANGVHPSLLVSDYSLLDKKEASAEKAAKPASEKKPRRDRKSAK